MKITELKCPSCGAVLKIADEKHPNIAKCEYCECQFGLEWEYPNNPNAEAYPKPAETSSGRIDRTLLPPVTARSDRPGLSIILCIIAFVLLFAAAAAIAIPAVKDTQPDKASELIYGIDRPATNYAVSEFIPSAQNEQNILMDFLEIVFERPIDEITEGEIAKIKWLEVKNSTDYRMVGYSFDNPLEHPDAELTWVTFSWYDYKSNSTDFLPAFTGLEMLRINQTLQKENLRGLPLQGICTYSDSLEQLSELIEKPEEIRYIEIKGNSVSLSGIDRFPNLESLTMDSDKIEEQRLLVNAKSLLKISVDMYDGSMDFSTFGMMPWLKELTISCKNIKDLSFVSKMENLQALRLKYGNFLSLDALLDTPQLEELSLLSCDEIKDMSPITTLTGLKKLTLELPYNCAQPDLSPLTAMEELYVESFDDTAFLKNMNNLTKLTLDGGSSYNPADFTDLVNLKELCCTSFGRLNQDYSFITSLPALEILDLHGTSTYKDISGIFNIKTLKSLNINGMECEIDFDRIAPNTTLETLYIDHVSLYENVVISGGGGFYSIDYDKVYLSEHLDFFNMLTGLKNLSISDNELTSLDFAASLGALQTIDFSDNYVTDLMPLSNLKDLRQINCTDNPISNFESLGDSVIVLQ